MKLNLKTIAITIAVIFIASIRMTAQTKTDFIGKWDTYAPDAPIENQKSVFIINENSASVIIDDSGNYSDSNAMTLKNDTLRFEIGGVSFWLKAESKTKLKGMAKWEDGQTILTMTKIEEPQKPEAKKQ
jgi:hypothetical protein